MGFPQFMSPDEIVIFIWFLNHYHKSTMQAEFIEICWFADENVFISLFLCLTWCLVVQNTSLLYKKKKKKKEILVTWRSRTEKSKINITE